MSRLTLSETYWAVWIFVLFLVPELLAAFNVIPMRTLSDTAWINEERYPVLRTLIMGFLIGLAFHIRFETRFGRAEAAGIAIAVILHLAYGA